MVAKWFCCMQQGKAGTSTAQHAQTQTLQTWRKHTNQQAPNANTTNRHQNKPTKVKTDMTVTTHTKQAPKQTNKHQNNTNRRNTNELALQQYSQHHHDTTNTNNSTTGTTTAQPTTQHQC